MKKVFTKERTEQLVNIGGVLLLTILATILNSRVTKDEKIVSRFDAKTNNYDGQIYYGYGRSGYSDAIKAITSSDMFSHDMHRAVSIVKVNDNSEYYKAVKAIAESDMFSNRKSDAILNISKSCEEES